MTFPLKIEGFGWLNELGSWITQQLTQAYHQYGVGSRPALYITKKVIKFTSYLPMVGGSLFIRKKIPNYIWKKSPNYIC